MKKGRRLFGCLRPENMALPMSTTLPATGFRKIKIKPERKCTGITEGGGGSKAVHDDNQFVQKFKKTYAPPQGLVNINFSSRRNKRMNLFLLPRFETRVQGLLCALPETGYGELPEKVSSVIADIDDVRTLRELTRSVLRIESD